MTCFRNNLCDVRYSLISSGRLSVSCDGAALAIATDLHLGVVGLKISTVPVQFSNISSLISLMLIPPCLIAPIT